MICPMVCPMIPSGNTASYKGELQRWSYKGGATTATEDGPKNKTQWKHCQLQRCATEATTLDVSAKEFSADLVISLSINSQGSTPFAQEPRRYSFCTKNTLMGLQRNSVQILCYLLHQCFFFHNCQGGMPCAQQPKKKKNHHHHHHHHHHEEAFAQPLKKPTEPLLLHKQCKRKNLEDPVQALPAQEDEDDGMTVMQFVLNLRNKKKQQEQDDDHLTLLDLLRNSVQDQAQKKHKKEKKRKKKGMRKKKKKKHTKQQQADKKFWQRWGKRLSYMEELGEVEGNRLYMDEHAQNAKAWRCWNKRKREEEDEKKQEKKQQKKKSQKEKKYTNIIII